ncbi:hypothetical protein CAAN1_01S00936 [[Candida] anglica]|uniref:Phosphoglycerate mutase n=1 Tax=[Candida] anglica TaxID=148631 RepID=A0ABP0EL52_9ASCO
MYVAGLEILIMYVDQTKEKKSNSMSLLIPNKRDWVDAHSDLDEDVLFHEKWQESKVNLNSYWKFEPVANFFKQTDESTDDMAFNYATEDFGIKSDWETLKEELKELNASSKYGEKYKLLFLARHGQGWHNVASVKYSPEDWFNKWRLLGTDGELTWGPDANLTPLGVNQAKENNQLWKEQLAKGAPFPTKFIVSPLQRSSHTLVHTWEGINIPNPIVVEKVRETIGANICHQRATKTIIGQRFSTFEFEPEFTENDEIFDKFTPGREKLHQQFLRVNEFLQELFENDDNTVISITSHAGTIRAFITAVGHRKFTIPTGGMIPIVIRGEKIINN